MLLRPLGSILWKLAEATLRLAVCTYTNVTASALCHDEAFLHTGSFRPTSDRRAGAWEDTAKRGGIFLTDEAFPTAGDFA